METPRDTRRRRRERWRMGLRDNCEGTHRKLQTQRRWRDRKAKDFLMEEKNCLRERTEEMPARTQPSPSSLGPPRQAAGGWGPRRVGVPRRAQPGES